MLVQARLDDSQPVGLQRPSADREDAADLRVDYRKQSLTVFAPIPADADDEDVQLLLDGPDAKIYCHLRKHGKTKPADGGVKIKYRGDRIYSGGEFRIDGQSYTPNTLKVKRN